MIFAVNGESAPCSRSREQPEKCVCVRERERERERRVEGEGNFILRGLLGGVDEGFVVFCGDFLMGFVEMPIFVLQIVLGRGCCSITFDDTSSLLLGWVHRFFAIVSPLFHHFFKFVDISISSGCSLSVFFFLLLFQLFWLVLEVGMKVGMKAMMKAVWIGLNYLVLMLLLLLLLSLLLFLLFYGLKNFFPFLVTWVHPFSGLFDWSSGSMALPAFFFWLLLLVVVLMVVVLLLAAAFWAQLRARCPNCL